MVDLVTLSDSEDDAPPLDPPSNPHPNDALFRSLINTVKDTFTKSDHLNSAPSKKQLDKVLDTIIDYQMKRCSVKFLQSDEFRDHIVKCLDGFSSDNALEKLTLFVQKMMCQGRESLPELDHIPVKPDSSSSVKKGSLMTINPASKGSHSSQDSDSDDLQIIDSKSPSKHPNKRRRVTPPRPAAASVPARTVSLPQLSAKVRIIGKGPRTKGHKGITSILNKLPKVPAVGGIGAIVPNKTTSITNKINNVVQSHIQQSLADLATQFKSCDGLHKTFTLLLNQSITDTSDFWCKNSLADVCRVYKTMTDTDLLMQKLHDLLQLLHFRKNPLIMPISFESEQPVDFNIKYYLRLILFRNGCEKVLPDSHKNMVKVFYQFFGKSSQQQKDLVCKKLEKLPFSDSSKFNGEKEYAAALIKCLNDMIEMLLSSFTQAESEGSDLEILDSAPVTKAASVVSAASSNSDAPDNGGDTPETDGPPTILEAVKPEEASSSVSTIEKTFSDPCKSSESNLNEPVAESSDTPKSLLVEQPVVDLSTLPLAQEVKRDADVTKDKASSKTEALSETAALSETVIDSQVSEASTETLSSQVSNAVSETFTDCNTSVQDPVTSTDPDHPSSQPNNITLFNDPTPDNPGTVVALTTPSSPFILTSSQEEGFTTADEADLVIASQTTDYSQREELIIDEKTEKELLGETNEAIALDNKKDGQERSNPCEKQALENKEYEVPTEMEVGRSDTPEQMDTVKSPVTSPHLEAMDTTEPLEEEDVMDIEPHSVDTQGMEVESRSRTQSMELGSTDEMVVPDKEEKVEFSKESLVLEKVQDKEISRPDKGKRRLTLSRIPLKPVVETPAYDEVGTGSLNYLFKDGKECFVTLKSSKLSSETIEEDDDGINPADKTLLEDLANYDLEDITGKDVEEPCSQSSIKFVREKSPDDCFITNIKASNVQYVAVDHGKTKKRKRPVVNFSEDEDLFGGYAESSGKESDKDDFSEKTVLKIGASSKHFFSSSIKALNIKNKLGESSKEVGENSKDGGESFKDEGVSSKKVDSIKEKSRAEAGKGPKAGEGPKAADEEVGASSEEDNSIDESSEEYQVKVAEIRKCTKRLGKLSRRIRAVQEADIDMEELDKWNNLFSQEHSLKKKHRKELKRLQELQGELEDLEYHFEVSVVCGIPPVETYVQNKINQRQKFPDLQDVTRLVERAMKRNDIKMKESRVKGLCTQIFQEVGTQIQAFRKKEFFLDGGTHLSDKVNPSLDPARLDRELRSKLKKNKQIAKEKYSEIQTEFGKRQFEKECRGDETESEDEGKNDDNEDNNGSDKDEGSNKDKGSDHEKESDQEGDKEDEEEVKKDDERKESWEEGSEEEEEEEEDGVTEVPTICID